MTDPTQNQQPLCERDFFQIREKTYFRLHNNHQACFVLLPHHLRRLIDRGLFGENEHGQHHSVWGYDLMCSASMVPYNPKEGGYQKVVALEDFEKLLVHHAPDK
jgi:hypothetical protein